MLKTEIFSIVWTRFLLLHFQVQVTKAGAIWLLVPALWFACIAQPTHFVDACFGSSSLVSVGNC